MVKNALDKMKNKKAGDSSNWKAEWLKEAGKEMVKSMVTLYNRIEEEGKI